MLTQPMNSSSAPAPRLPRPLAVPLALVPGFVHSGLLVQVLNRVFAPQLREGELEFLQGRILSIRVLDAGLEYRLSLRGSRFAPCRPGAAPDAVFAGSAYDLFQLASRREDSDTLFFQRRLMLEGDTELGLQLKNLLDGLDYEELAIPAPLLRLLRGLVR